MSDYTELVKALRWCASDETDCEGNCPYSFMTDCLGKIKLDAAAAIEELQADVEEQKQIAAHYEQSAKDWWAEACDYYAIASARDITAEESEELIKKFKKLPVGPIEPIKIKPIKPHWVSVEERLPDRYDAYAVGWRYPSGCFYWGKVLFYDGKWQVDEEIPTPDYWMPIEPPQEVQDGTE